MGSEQYETLIGLGFAGYLFILFYCSILLQIKPTNSEWKPLHYAKGVFRRAKNILRLEFDRTIEQYPKKR